MTLIVPNVAEIIAMNSFLNNALSLRLYSNNITPASGNTAATYTQVSGGGYAAKSLSFASWSVTSGDPTVALYTAQNFSFTGPTSAPGTIYGYYIVDSGGVLRWAERFPIVPFTPIVGSLIRITPRIQLG